MKIPIEQKHICIFILELLPSIALIFLHWEKKYRWSDKIDQISQALLFPKLLVAASDWYEAQALKTYYTFVLTNWEQFLSILQIGITNTH